MMFTKADIEHYFSVFCEQQVVLLVTGALALLAAIIIYVASKGSAAKGFILPMAVFGLLFSATGFSNYQKANVLRVRALYNYDLHPDLLKIKELPRVRGIERDLQLLIDVNMCIIAAALFLFFYFRNRMQQEYFRSAALSLFIFSSASIIIYLWMLMAAKPYEAGIFSLTEKIIVNKSGG